MSTDIIAPLVLPAHKVAPYIMAVGDRLTIKVISQPGVGKTALLATIAELNGDKWRKQGDYFPEDKYCYLNWSAPDMAIEDVRLSMPVMETKTVEAFIGALLKSDDKRPKVINFDELTKAQKVLAPTLRNLYYMRCIPGTDYVLPEGSIVFATGNNESDGLGDRSAAHEDSTVVTIYMAPPTCDHWIQWAMNNGISATTMLAARLNKQRWFQSYLTDDVSENPDVFHPQRQQKSFVCPRSLALNDVNIRKAHLFDKETLYAAISGTLGRNAANAFMAIINVERELPALKDILTDPLGTFMPSGIPARMMIAYKYRNELETQEDIGAFIKYVERFECAELEAAVVHALWYHKKLGPMAQRNPTLHAWMKRDDNGAQFATPAR